MHEANTSVAGALYVWHLIGSARLINRQWFGAGLCPVLRWLMCLSRGGRPVTFSLPGGQAWPQTARLASTPGNQGRVGVAERATLQKSAREARLGMEAATWTHLILCFTARNGALQLLAHTNCQRRRQRALCDFTSHWLKSLHSLLGAIAVDWPLAPHIDRCVGHLTRLTMMPTHRAGASRDRKTLLCKAKRKYLLTYKVSRYYLLAMHDRKSRDSKQRCFHRETYIVINPYLIAVILMKIADGLVDLWENKKAAHFPCGIENTARVQWIRSSSKGSHFVYWTSILYFPYIALKWNTGKQLLLILQKDKYAC